MTHGSKHEAATAAKEPGTPRPTAAEPFDAGQADRALRIISRWLTSRPGRTVKIDVGSCGQVRVQAFEDTRSEGLDLLDALAQVATAVAFDPEVTP